MVPPSFNFFLVVALLKTKLKDWIKKGAAIPHDDMDVAPTEKKRIHSCSGHIPIIPHDQVIVAPAELKSKSKRIPSRSGVPVNLMIDILSKLPARSLVRFRSVCKLWNSLFRDSYFVKLQLIHSAKNPATFFCYFEFKQVSVYPFKIDAAGMLVLPYNNFSVPVAGDCIARLLWNTCSNTCDGLVAFYYWSHVYVVNPCTREWMSPPMMTGHYSPDSVNRHPSLGFGFCKTSGKYKLVRIFCGNRVSWSWEVLTLGTDRSWRSLGDAPHRLSQRFLPTYANGFLYWTMADSGEDTANPAGILSFDVSQERFMTEFLLPRFHPGPYGDYRHLYMSVIEGSLCLVDWRAFFNEKEDSTFPVIHIHELKKDFIWKERRSIKLQCYEPNFTGFPEDMPYFPLDTHEGKIILYCYTRPWWLHNLHTRDPSIIISSSAYTRWQHIRNCTIPFTCAQSIIPIDWLQNHPDRLAQELLGPGIDRSR